MKFQEFKKELQALEFTELIDLYIEAKTGKNTLAEELLSVEEVELIYSLEEAIKEAILTN
jgi:hypothetical protein